MSGSLSKVSTFASIRFTISMSTSVRSESVKYWCPFAALFGSFFGSIFELAKTSSARRRFRSYKTEMLYEPAVGRYYGAAATRM
jgi:hypothetical protein